MGLFSEAFIWWHRQTLGTRLYTFRKGKFVGTDSAGNTYYEEKTEPKGRPKKRWVIYSAGAEASHVPADWHGWIHHTFDEPPTTAPFKLKPWEKNHVPNQTGTSLAYRPSGSLFGDGERAEATGDYEAWRPDS